MRVLKFLFSAIITLGILAVVGGIIGREVLLRMGSGQVRQSLAILRTANREAGQYLSQCRQKGGNELSGGLTLQLRFVDSRTYLLEAICPQFTLEPILIEQKTLPPFVTKIAGSTGVVLGEDHSQVILETFGRKTTISVEAQTISVVAKNTGTTGLMPNSTCAGYGYQCCSPDSASGQGGQYARVTDCPRDCFAQCLPKPVVLSLTSDPFPDPGTRTVFLPQGTPINLNYVISNAGFGKQPLQVKMEFGDGQVADLTALSGQVDHDYDCPTGKCSYIVKVIAISPQGVKSAETPITQLTVQLVPYVQSPEFSPPRN